MAPHSTAAIHLLFLRSIYFVLGGGGDKGKRNPKQKLYFGLFLLCPTTLSILNF